MITPSQKPIHAETVSVLEHTPKIRVVDKQATKDEITESTGCQKHAIRGFVGSLLRPAEATS
jgi:hypothetical protein